MIEKGRLLSLVEFVQQSARLRTKPFSTVAQHGQFSLHEHQLQGLPGIRLNFGDADSGDEVWLIVERLYEQKPPDIVSPALRPWVQVSSSPTEEPKLLQTAGGNVLIAAGTYRSNREAGSRDETTKPAIDPAAAVHLSELPTEGEIRSQFEVYLKSKWQPWAYEEQLRRRTIRIYAQLFTLKQQIEGGIVEAQLEVVWGVGLGISKWKATTISYPLVTRLVEISLNPTNAQIEVRPRDVDARLEIDWYASVDNPGVAELERAAKDFFRSNAKTFSPFDRGTFEPLLRVAASHLDANGVYWPNETQPEDRTLPGADENLRVTDTWVLFARPRTQSVFLQDLERLKGAIEKVEQPELIPGAVAAIVTNPSDTNPVVELPSFRGVCASYEPGLETPSKKVRDLYFPKAFNNEQLRIIQLLDVADGVVVQGPPGTGKTHTIANVICHYLAEGKRVLVTSMKEPALTVLQGQLPDEIQPLAISLLSSEQLGMKQFEHAIQKIASEVQTINRAEMARDIAHLDESIGHLHGRLAAIDRKVNDWATKNLAKFWLDSEEVNPLDAAHEVVEGSGQFEWLPDSLGLSEQFSPQITDSDLSVLRNARRTLGDDIDYLNASLPQLIQFPDSSEILQVHRDLSQLEKLKAGIAAGEVPALAGSPDGAIDEMHQLASRLAVLLELTDQIERAGNHWTPVLREQLKQGNRELFSLLDALGVELEQAVSARTQFIRRPVILPSGIELDNEINAAIANMCENRKPFGIAGFFGKSQQKSVLDRIRVLGHAPGNAEDWKHVHGCITLLNQLRTLSLRWNALTSELGIPAVETDRPDGGVLAARHYEFYLTLKKQVTFAQDVLSCALKLFPTWRGSGPDSERWKDLQRVVRHHIDRQTLANVWIAKERFQKVLEGKSGRIVDGIWNFLDHRLGNPAVDEVTMQAEWSALMAELSHALALEGDLKAVREICRKIEMSGAENWAAGLREKMKGTTDPLLPDNWRRAWRLRRLATYLDSIDPRDDLKRLAKARRETEGLLANAYRDVVVRRTWLKLAENASPSIRAALQSYLAAIQKIGKGTGKRAVRFRQDARNAASKANPAVPCWIMPHYRVSESLPPELGCFHLVIIDEASQSDLTALPALLRAEKVLVVGDDKQVSPEGVGLEEEKVRNLISRFLGGQVETYRPQMDPSRSIYDLFKVVFAANSVMLREHFRCVPPIIEYSKREFYNHELRPLRLPKTSERLDPPLIDVFVEDGYRKGHVNLPEIRFIIEEIKRIVADPRLVSRSIGVVSLLGGEQALRIWGRLTDEIGPDVMQRHLIACGDARTFQGKERDIMFLSMVSAPNEVGAPLSRDTFAQRFNVAASRARDRMYLVRSVALENLSEADRLRRSLIAHFACPFAQDETRVEHLRKLCESPFERDVYDLLVNRGYRVTPQVRVGQYRIDLVVEGDNDARLAVECDGDKYHGVDRWADDMHRQSDLERAGWSFWRSFASTFLRRKDDVVADLMGALSERGIEPLGIENRARSVHTEQRVVSSETIERAESEVEEFDIGETLFDRAGVSSAIHSSSAISDGLAIFVGPARSQEDEQRIEHDLQLRPQHSQDLESIIAYCRDQNLRLVDNRTKKGALWVVHPMSDGPTATALREMGLRFADGKGWWMK
ncbi:MAG TPA: AAA domain-containing protein [Rhizomicrobium sp.]|jgi:very-short-patch-repair endonuclease|nr:AAA domain-containing protein [Rhizomicrobium sp.]